MHWFLAISNACNWLKYVTRFSCDIFGFYVAFIYLQKGIQVLTRQWEAGDTSAYLSIMISLLVLMVAYIGGVIGNSNLFHRYARKFIEDYSTPLTVIFFTGKCAKSTSRYMSPADCRRFCPHRENARHRASQASHKQGFLPNN